MIYLIIKLNKTYKIMEKIEYNLNQNQIILSQREISSHLSFKKKVLHLIKKKKYYLIINLLWKNYYL